MKNALARLPLALMLTAILLLLIGCKAASMLQSPPPVRPAQIPPLMSAARQPPIPSECLPTCSAAASVELDSWLPMPTRPASPARPAKPVTTR